MSSRNCYLENMGRCEPIYYYDCMGDCWPWLICWI